MKPLSDTECVICGRPTGSTIFTTCMGCYDTCVGFPIYSKNINFPIPERIYEDYLYYVLKKKDEELYLDDIDRETKYLSEAYVTDQIHGIEAALESLVCPDEWEIRRMKITYGLLEGEGGE